MLAAMGSRASRAGQAGGCLLVGVGAVFALVAYGILSLTVDYWWQELSLWAIVVAGIAAVIRGIILIFASPKVEGTAARGRSWACRPAG